MVLHTPTTITNNHSRCHPAVQPGCLPDIMLSLFRYSILDTGSPFSIDPITGQLSVVRKLDREVEDRHEFKVRAEEENSGMSHTRINTARLYQPCHPKTIDPHRKRWEPYVLAFFFSIWGCYRWRANRHSTFCCCDERLFSVWFMKAESVAH